MDADERALWAIFRAAPSEPMRHRLVARYDGLTRTIAARIYGARSDDSVPFADYVQYARMGLLEAIDRFDLDRSTSFATFASQRIRGSILNGLTKESEFAAQRRFWNARRQERTDSLRTALAPHADRASLADIVTITMGLAIGAIVDGLGEQSDHADCNPQRDPYAVNELRQLSVAVRGLIARLPEREKEIILGHYRDQLEFRVMAERMSITKGRVSQLHAQALMRLRGWLEDRPKVDRKV